MKTEKETFESYIDNWFYHYNGSGNELMKKLKQLHDEEIKKHLITEVDLRLDIVNLHNDLVEKDIKIKKLNDLLNNEIGL